ncbi:MAG: ABC transporter ATP-binding protein [Dehalococcoidia bacterium]|nr:ABC transporter ATP-binding protein [Dehalococcoidia bacterium]
MGGVIQADNLTKYYGKSRGIEGLNLEVQEGEIFGFLGPNGAGKSTTIRLAMDFIRPTGGSIHVLGLDARRDVCEVHRRTGYLPGELTMYDRLTGEEMLSYLGHLRGGVDWRYVEELAERLDASLSVPFRSLSSGNKHKIGLIQALMRRPELLILDEPTSRLDPLTRQEFHRLLVEVRAEGRTVFLSSHILPEVERVCDRVGIIRQGRLVAVESVSALKARSLRRLELHFAAPVPQDAFAGLAGVRHVTVQDSVVRCEITGSVDAVVKAAAGYEVLDIISHEPDLEEVFLAYYSGENDVAD